MEFYTWYKSSRGRKIMVLNLPSRYLEGEFCGIEIYENNNCIMYSNFMNKSDMKRVGKLKAYVKISNPQINEKSLLTIFEFIFKDQQQ